MTSTEIKNQLSAAFQKNQDSVRLFSALAALKKQIDDAHASELEFSDRAEALQATIDECDVTVTDASLKLASFEKLSTSRRALRESKRDLEDIGDWRAKINFEIEALKAEYSEIKRQSDDFLNNQVINQVYLSINERFEQQADALAAVAVAWQDELSVFRRNTGGTISPRLRVELNTDAGRVLERCVR